MKDDKKTTNKPKKKPKKKAKPKSKPNLPIKVGRPKTLLNDLPNDWADVTLQLYTDGATDVEVRCNIYGDSRVMSEDLWYRLIKEESEFSLTIKRGHQLSYAWWIGRGRKGMGEGIRFNAVTWIFCMKNMFSKDWQDKKILDGNIKVDNKIILEVGEGKQKVHDVLQDRGNKEGS